MKKLISGIMAIAILASAVLCGTTTAFAADTGNSAVGDVDMWNHDFKNKLTGELMWAIDDIADTDTVAVEINLTSYYEDIYIFADKNDRLDEIIVNEDGGKTYSDELLRDYEEYKNNIRSQKPDDKKKIIDEKYSVSEIVGYLKGKSSLMIFDRHANLKYKYGNRHFWAEGYYVSTVGLNEATIKEYIQEQEKHDIALDKLSVKEYEDPFKGC